MKVCIVLPGFFPVPATKGGAIETLVEQLADENEAVEGIKLTIVSVYDKKACRLSKQYNNSRFFYIKKYRTLNILLRKFNSLLYVTLKRKIKFNTYLMRLGLFMKFHSFDFMVIEGGVMGAYKRISKIVGKDKMAYHFHGGNFNKIVGFTTGFEGIYTYYIAVSDYIRNNAIKYGGIHEDNIKTIYNCADLKRLQCSRFDAQTQMSLREKLGITRDDMVIVFSGRVIPEKGVRELVDAFISLDEGKYKLIIIGGIDYSSTESNEYFEEILKIAEDSKGSIVTTGYLDKYEVPLYLSIADIAVVPSMWEEPGALVLYEAMAMGLPLIVTDSGGNSEIVDRNCAIIVNKENDVVTKIKDAISAILRDDDLRLKMSEYSLKRSENFSTGNYYESYMETIKKFCSKNGESFQ